VTFSVASNTGAARSGELTIGDKTVPVNQLAADRRMFVYGHATDDLHRRSGLYRNFGVGDKLRSMCMDRREQCLLDFDFVRRQWQRQWHRDNRHRRKQRSGAFRDADDCRPDGHGKSSGGGIVFSIP
jgi:hypothetical protein